MKKMLLVLVLMLVLACPAWAATIDMHVNSTGAAELSTAGTTNITADGAVTASMGEGSTAEFGDGSSASFGDGASITTGTGANITAAGAAITADGATVSATGNVSLPSVTAVTTGATTNVTAGGEVTLTATGPVTVNVQQVAAPVVQGGIKRIQIAQVTVSGVPTLNTVVLPYAVDPAHTSIDCGDSAGFYQAAVPQAGTFGQWLFVNESNQVTTLPTNRIAFHCDGGRFLGGHTIQVFGRVVEYGADTTVRRLMIPLTFSAALQQVDITVPEFDPATTEFRNRRRMEEEEWRWVFVTPLNSTTIRVYYQASCTRTAQADFDMITHPLATE